jgi:trimeric autotransporter adhesin
MKRLLLPLFLLTTFITKAQIITTIAGTGTYGYSGDGGLATNAKLASPDGMCFDSAGNLIFADYANSRIRKIAASTGIITTIVGTGAAAFSGDGGLAINATLNGPSDVKMDSAGNLYIADFGNNRIRKVNAATNIITTIAGNGSQGISGENILATSAPMSPGSLCLDASQNNLYAIGGNNRVSKINLNTGIIITVAGSKSGISGFSGDGGLASAALLNVPVSIFLDVSDNMYITDMANNRIRKVDAVTKIITTVAGSSATGGFSGDGGLATAAKIWWPTNATVDNAGNIYIADKLNNRIRFVSQSTGIITTIAGNGTSGYSGDGGSATSAALKRPSNVTMDANNNIIIIDQSNNRIRKISGITLVQGNVLNKNASVAERRIAFDNKLSFKATPNPAKTNTKLLFQKNITNGFISIIDETGKTLYGTGFSGTEYLLNTSRLTPGIYFIKVSADNAAALQRIVIIK